MRISNIQFFLIGTVILASLMTFTVTAHALSIRIAQESSAGAGDFDSNLLGTMTAFETSLNISDFYRYNNPDRASYNGHLNGGPTLVSSLTQLFLVNASDGLSLVTVHDDVEDGSGGRTHTAWDLSGDTAGFSLSDDPGEGLSISGGGTHFESRKNWIGCCTDGFAIGALEGDWSMLGSFMGIPTGISAWAAVSSDFSTVGLTLETGRRVRLDKVPAPIPEPSTWILMISGLLGLFLIRRWKRFTF